jgi:hypothetical protein
MFSFGFLSFAAPWALAALIALPALWWLLRLTPPRPRRQIFPPLVLLREAARQDETSAHTPWWLLLLRLSLIAAAIFAAAHPLLNPNAQAGGGGPLVLIVDDGWAAARHWPARRDALTSLLDQASREDRTVVALTTAPQRRDGPPPQVRIMRPEQARETLLGLRPKPWATDPKRAIDALFAPDGPKISDWGRVVWLTDGLAKPGLSGWVDTLRRLGPVTLMADEPARLARVLRPPVAQSNGIEITLERAPVQAPETVTVLAIGDDGQALDRRPVTFESGAGEAKALIDLPSELRNRLAQLRIDGEQTAGAVVLVDERWRRRPVGLVAADSGFVARQPLLGPLYYLERALTPVAEVRRGTVGELLGRELAVMMLADPGPIAAEVRSQLDAWIERGGIAMRFAGPRLAKEPDTLVPVALRGERIMGGALSWSRPARLAEFDEQGPFRGLAVPTDVTVNRQLLPSPGAELAGKVWARLSDGTPLVTATQQGKGWLILVHTTANAEWSDFALSGTFVAMLRRIIEMGRGVVADEIDRSLSPQEVLDGFGQLGVPGADVIGIPGRGVDSTIPGPGRPPGYYGEADARRAVNLSWSLPPPTAVEALSVSATVQTYSTQATEIDLRPWLWGLALILALIDLAASLTLRRVVRLGTASLVAIIMFSPNFSVAQPVGPEAEAFARAASLETRLAYVITGNAEVDNVSRAGLTGLGVIVNRRTAAELAAPVGVDPANDSLLFFPFLYWPLTAQQQPLSDLAAQKLNEYMRGGGTIVFDSRDPATGAPGDLLDHLARVLDFPALVQVPEDHVLNRSYYLLRDIPGRWTGGTVWVERAGERVNDGVSSVVFGNHDWAAAWAMDDAQRPLYMPVPNGERQRELAYRFGINLVMYALTGNYKADQVHLPSILQRLGL